MLLRTRLRALHRYSLAYRCPRTRPSNVGILNSRHISSLAPAAPAVVSLPSHVAGSMTMGNQRDIASFFAGGTSSKKVGIDVGWSLRRSSRVAAAPALTRAFSDWPARWRSYFRTDSSAHSLARPIVPLFVRQDVPPTVAAGASKRQKTTRVESSSEDEIEDVVEASTGAVPAGLAAPVAAAAPVASAGSMDEADADEADADAKSDAEESGAIQMTSVDALVTWTKGDPVPFSVLTEAFERIADTTKRLEIQP